MRCSHLMLFLATLLTGAGFASAQTQPHIVHFFVDDMGVGTAGAYGQSLIQTPNLDQLAADGMIFSRAYTTPLCKQSRASLMTGLHNGHAYVDRNGGTVNYREQDVMVSEVLNPAGYTTGIFGKWGFGGTSGTQTNGDKTYDLRVNPSVDVGGGGEPALPNNQGFDHFYGYINHTRAHRYFVSSLWETDPNATYGISERMTGNLGDNNTQLFNANTHDLIADESEQFVLDNMADGPMYMQVNYTIPHNDVEWVNFTPEGQGIYANENWTEKEKNLATMITRMDARVGDLVNLLETTDDPNNPGQKLIDNTLIMFTSDNGATSEDIGLDTMEFFDVNAGLRGGKRDLWEGGIRAPLIVRWDGKVAPGSTSDHMTGLADFMATAADVAGTRAPVGIDGTSIVPTLTGQGFQRVRDYLIMEHHEGDGPDADGRDARWTIVQSDYKLIAFANGDHDLYHLPSDPDESNALSTTTYADMIGDMRALALAEGAEEAFGYGVDYRQWRGMSGDAIENGDKWDVISTPAENWSAVIDDSDIRVPRAPGDYVVNANVPVTTLGVEVGGVNDQVTLLLNPDSSLEGRNEVRVTGMGHIHLDAATLRSNRWIDNFDDGQITGHGTIEGDLYNQSIIAPGRPDYLAAAQALPTIVDDRTQTAVDFDFVGQDISPMTNTSTLSQYVVLEQGFSFGPGTRPRAVDSDSNAGNEFNVTGFPEGGTLTDAIAGEDYLTFTLKPRRGIAMRVSQVGVDFWRNGSNAATDYAILTSITGFGAGDALGTLTNVTSTSDVSFVVNDTSGIASADPIEFRIYGWGQGGSNGNTHFDDAWVTASFQTVPGVALETAGVLTIDGDFYHMPGGELRVDLGGTGVSDPLNPEFDRLLVNGAFSVEGNLTIALENGYNPGAGDSYDLLDFASISGSFDSVSLPSLAAGLQWNTDNLLVDGTIMVVQGLIPGDMNLDGNVDMIDVDFFIAGLVDLNNYASQVGLSVADAIAVGDLNMDGQFDGLDIDGFVTLLTSTTGISAVVIPEPASLGLMSLGGLTLLRRGRAFTSPFCSAHASVPSVHDSLRHFGTDQTRRHTS